MLSSTSGDAAREIWLRYGRWLVAALTFQLAADIVETLITENRERSGVSQRLPSSGHPLTTSWKATSRRSVSARSGVPRTR